MNKLNVWALGLACGIIWGAAMLFLGLVNISGMWGHGIMEVMSSLYIGYTPSVIGSIIGGLWGFIDAGTAGIVLAWLYNRLAK